MIRILHMISGLNVGGSQALVMNMYRKIDRSKVQFDFILDHKDELYFADEVKQLGGKIFFMPRFKGVNYAEVRNAWTLFFEQHPEYRILHSHVRSYASIYFMIAKKYGVKTIIHSHSTSNGKGILSVVKKCLQYPLRFQADYLFACSDSAGRWLYGAKACRGENYLYVPNGIDVENYKYNHEVREKYRNQLGITNKYVIGHVGRFHESKNHLFLLDVFKKIYERRNDAVLLLVGDGDLKELIENQVEELGIKDAVYVLGNRKDVSELMQAMDVFVFPSVWEGLGIVVIEAQATGLRVIASNRVPKETRMGNKISYLPLNNDVNQWADEVLSSLLMEDRSTGYQEVCNAGYDIDKVIEKIISVYEYLWEIDI